MYNDGGYFYNICCRYSWSSCAWVIVSGRRRRGWWRRGRQSGSSRSSRRWRSAKGESWSIRRSQKLLTLWLAMVRLNRLVTFEWTRLRFEVFILAKILDFILRVIKIISEQFKGRWLFTLKILQKVEYVQRRVCCVIVQSLCMKNFR